MEMRNFHKMTTELDVSKMAENELIVLSSFKR